MASTPSSDTEESINAQRSSSSDAQASRCEPIQNSEETIRNCKIQQQVQETIESDIQSIIANNVQVQQSSESNENYIAYQLMQLTSAYASSTIRNTKLQEEIEKLQNENKKLQETIDKYNEEKQERKRKFLEIAENLFET